MEEKKQIKKQSTLGKIIIEMKIKNILDYLSNCFIHFFSKKKKNTDSNNPDQ